MTTKAKFMQLAESAGIMVEYRQGHFGLAVGDLWPWEIIVHAPEGRVFDRSALCMEITEGQGDVVPDWSREIKALRELIDEGFGYADDEET